MAATATSTTETINTFHVQPSLSNIPAPPPNYSVLPRRPRRPRRVRHAVHGALRTADTLLAKAIQQIATITGTFKDAFVAWLGSAENGIGKFFASEGHFAKEVCVGKSNGSEICLTGDELAAMAKGSVAAGASTSGVEAPDGSSTPVVEAGMDTATTTTSSVDDQITSDGTLTPDIPPPANDNVPLPDLPATDTDASTTAQ